MDKGAFISKCSKYRYGLWRQWDKKKANICFIMLNPSTADGKLDDPTVRRCISYAYDWGYGGLYVVNLLPYITSNLKELNNIEIPDPIIENNVTHIKSVDPAVDTFICAWGAHKVKEKIKDSLRDLFLDFMHKGKLYTLGLNKNGTPKHPLYLSKDLKPTEFRI